MNRVIGGGGAYYDNCFCACRYANYGGSSTSGNGGANKASNLSSPPDIEECVVLG
jgi:hypothetical protein